MPSNKTPFVSIIIPCRNEEAHIERCLISVIKNDYPKSHLEIILIDGKSTDNTRTIIQTFQKHYSFIALLDNPHKTTPYALNIGIKNARGELTMRMDAHTIYAEDYISKCVTYSTKYNADNVGGVWKIKPQKNTLIGKSIACVLNHPLSGGNAYYRTGHFNEPKEVDTVPFGCYRREVFDKIGLFNENLKRSQDMEFNIRLKKAGGKIMLFPDIVSYYCARSSLKEFIRHNYSNGIWAIYPLKFVKTPLSLRHYVPALFVTSIITSIALTAIYKPFLIFLLLILIPYIFITFAIAFAIAYKEKAPLYIFTLPLIFATLHLFYGIGSLVGAIMLLTKNDKKTV